EVTAANNWNYTFTDMPAYDNDGNAYTYTVREQTVAGYKSEV
ncbi:Cna B-type domain-containing protein, partial [Bacillus sp. JJ864]